MKSWYDSSKEERKKLSKEFHKNNKKSFILKCILYTIAIVIGFIFLVLFYLKSSNVCLEGSFCDLHTTKFGIAFAISLVLAIICSLVADYIDNRKFVSWLETSKKIKK